MSDRIELSCGLPPGPGFTERVALAERLGYRRVWIFDSAPLWEDPFVHLALAAERTSRIGLATAVLVPGERSVMSTASAIATVARLADGRFRACFGTGFTSMLAAGRRPMRLDDFVAYVGAVRTLLAGGTADVDGARVRMLHAPGLAAPRPVDVPIWVSVFGPRGAARAADVADGVVGPPHPSLPTATMVSGTVLDPGEDAMSPRVIDAVGPWRVLAWHGAHARGGAAAVDALPGGAAWRAELESLAPPDERHLLTFEGHVTHLAPRDLPLVHHADAGGTGRGEITGDPTEVGAAVEVLADAGFSEVIYTPSGPDVARELSAFASACGAGSG